MTKVWVRPCEFCRHAARVDAMLEVVVGPMVCPLGPQTQPIHTIVEVHPSCLAPYIGVCRLLGRFHHYDGRGEAHALP